MPKGKKKASDPEEAMMRGHMMMGKKKSVSGKKQKPVNMAKKKKPKVTMMK